MSRGIAVLQYKKCLLKKHVESTFKETDRTCSLNQVMHRKHNDSQETQSHECQSFRRYCDTLLLCNRWVQWIINAHTDKCPYLC